MAELSAPPRIDDLMEAIPAMFSDNPEEVQATLKPFADTLNEFGYSQAEINAENDPRTFLMIKELHELRDLASRVKKRKAVKSEETGIVKRPTKAKGQTPNSLKSKGRTKTDQEIMSSPDYSPADHFMDIDF